MMDEIICKFIMIMIPRLCNFLNKTMKDIILISLLLFACKKPKEEVYYKGSFNPVSTSTNDCGLILNIDTDGDGGSDLRSYPINPPDSVYDFLEI